VAAFLDRTEAALRALPGVTSVSAATRMPLSGGAFLSQITFPGAPGNTGDERDHPLVDRIHARAGYVQTMGMRLLAGRDFEFIRPQGVREALIDRIWRSNSFRTAARSAQPYSLPEPR
jgi:hypothetical protein